MTSTPSGLSETATGAQAAVQPLYRFVPTDKHRRHNTTFTSSSSAAGGNLPSGRPGSQLPSAEHAIPARILTNLSTLVTLLEKQNNRFEAIENRLERSENAIRNSLQAIDECTTKQASTLEMFSSVTLKVLKADLHSLVAADLLTLRNEAAEFREATKSSSETTSKQNQIASLQAVVQPLQADMRQLADGIRQVNERIDLMSKANEGTQPLLPILTQSILQHRVVTDRFDAFDRQLQTLKTQPIIIQTVPVPGPTAQIKPAPSTDRVSVNAPLRHAATPTSFPPSQSPMNRLQTTVATSMIPNNSTNKQPHTPGTVLQPIRTLSQSAFEQIQTQMSSEARQQVPYRGATPAQQGSVVLQHSSTVPSLLRNNSMAAANGKSATMTIAANQTPRVGTRFADFSFSAIEQIAQAGSVPLSASNLREMQRYDNLYASSSNNTFPFPSPNRPLPRPESNTDLPATVVPNSRSDSNNSGIEDMLRQSQMTNLTDFLFPTSPKQAGSAKANGNFSTTNNKDADGSKQTSHLSRSKRQETPVHLTSAPRKHLSISTTTSGRPESSGSNKRKKRKINQSEEEVMTEDIPDDESLPDIRNSMNRKKARIVTN